ncbi:hypothetical protein WG66_006734 [Moniliophthora roreri]|uniref:Uncharacterized protein n=1 Tax=Moniliophthora roreri TaxID=221103 RepID=A0A0W0ETI5_MONRR|nr:hypothetical protein WG66_006734 [Moniliophthora roreri]
MPNEEHLHTQLAMDQLECDSDVDSYCLVNSGPVSPTFDPNPNENINDRLLFIETKLDTLITTYKAQNTPNPLVDYLETKVNELERQNRQWEIDTKEFQSECSRLADSLREAQAKPRETKNNLDVAEAENVTDLCKAEEDVKDQTRMRVDDELEPRTWERRCMDSLHEKDALVSRSRAELDQARAELNIEKTNTASLQIELHKAQADVKVQTRLRTDQALQYKAAVAKMEKEKDDQISKLAAELELVRADLKVEKTKNKIALLQAELTPKWHNWKNKCVELQREKANAAVGTHDDQSITALEPERAKADLEAMEEELVALKQKKELTSRWEVLGSIQTVGGLQSLAEAMAQLKVGTEFQPEEASSLMALPLPSNELASQWKVPRVNPSVQTERRLPPLAEAMAQLKVGTESQPEVSSLMELPPPPSNLKKECAEVRDRFFAPRETSNTCGVVTGCSATALITGQD